MSTKVEANQSDTSSGHSSIKESSLGLFSKCIFVYREISQQSKTVKEKLAH